MAADPAFTVELDLSQFPSGRDWVSYRRLIDDIRSRLGVRFSHNHPVLQLEQRIPPRWFDIVLRTSRDYAVRFRLRADNLYLVGYRMEQGTDQRWFEFADDDGNPQQLIAGSNGLGFGGSYNALMRRDAANWSWTDIRIGRKDLLHAVERLNTTNRQQRAQSLLPVIIMLSESIRMNDIKEFNVTNHAESRRVPVGFEDLVHAWGNLSERLLHADADPNHYFRIPENNFGIQTAEQAIAALGILKDCSFKFHPPHGRFRREAGDDGYHTHGQPLVEVFWVRMKDIEEENYLYGTITVTDGLTCQYIYNRKRVRPESIYAGDTILLTGPPRSISAYDSFAIDVDLMDANKVSSSAEVAYGKISWNVFSTASNVYDQPLSKDLDGRNGSVTVNYVVISNAVEARIEITLVNGGGQYPAQVYGLITARSNKFRNESMLFWKTSNDEDLNVRPGQNMDLLKSTVAVPLDSSFIVRAELFNRNRETGTNNEIANGTAAFPVHLSGTYTKKISGGNGEIKVKVSWIDI
ncbi:uncharacterized protein LOC131151490 [Malania oleifera]|uniref:uncharacterized protein LOC131151490 n=1 Tax=Malania oleifera TaxID=397392 RepID=UPI0025AE7FD8|nr:uncharacterized protein LOC131151490 [Malania oleifera]